MNLTQKYNKLPPPIKYVIIGATFYIGYKIFSKIFKSDSEQLTDDIQTTNLTDIQKWKNAGQTPNFTASQYISFANTIYEGTKYGLGDDYGDVVDVCKKMKNNLDVALLVKAYGTKQNYVFGLPDGTERDLFTNLRKELGNEYIGLVAYRLKQINDNWQSKGITYIL
jgi:uncharacterized membrane protein YdfJ with MMPL/SSD domain